jgi:pimeloyl-ACP methyl ester carboxylesterase
LARPWFDPVALHYLAWRFFPLSRAWAVAMDSEGSLQRFLDGVSIGPVSRATRRRLVAALASIERLGVAAEAAEERWREAAFGPASVDGAYLREAEAALRQRQIGLAEAETARRAAAHALMATRRHFTLLPRRHLIPPVRYAVPRPAEFEARYADLLAAPERAYAAPSPAPEVAESGRCTGPHGTQHWIRFASPSATMADTVYARVLEPAGVADPPTLIFGHGLWVEGEQWRSMPDLVAALCYRGVRVVHVESPWHGRRAPLGEYGGERFFATAPQGVLELFSAQAREVAAITAWARRSSAGRVAVGGISLGAQVAQLVAVHARHWPAEMRPDALLLITSCDRIDEVAFKGSLCRAFHLDRALRARGWSPEELARWRPLIDPVGAPAVAPENVVAVLGRADSVTPYALGKALLERWGVPPENVFARRQGHFSAAIGAFRDTRHLDRLHQILAG